MWLNFPRLRQLVKRVFFAVSAIAVGVMLMAVLLPLPASKPLSLVVKDRNGEFLHAFLASDGVWRIHTPASSIPDQLKRILLRKEDRFFYYHPGVNPFAIVRALWQNAKAGGRVSGASTITMQVARMLEPKQRTYGGKLVEMFRAIQLEFRFSKEEILSMYLSMIPLGGNIEGLSSSALLYYQTPLERLNIAQLIDLILIPNDPNGLRPDRYGEKLRKERIRRSRPWIAEQLLSDDEARIIEESDSRVVRITPPRLAPHFAQRVKSAQFPHEGMVVSSLDLSTQRLVERLTRNHLRVWRGRGVENGAAFVLDNRTMEVVAYVGSPEFEDSLRHGEVDAVRALRSPGSTLKPLLYASAMDKGILTPKTRMLDVPYDLDGYVAENYDGMFNGSLFADDALRKSLNVPMVRLLKSVGLPEFLDLLSEEGFASLDRQRDNLGLSVILGGCGVTLEELVAAAAAFPRGGVYARPSFLHNEEGQPSTHRVFSESAAYMVTEILSSMDRPDVPAQLPSDVDGPTLAYKTGTSYGRRDAWCIGYTAAYTAGVWLGNVTNAGSPELVGSRAATPLLVEILRSIDHSHTKNILPMPDDMNTRDVCVNSGLLPTEHCSDLIEDTYSITHTLNTFCDIDREYLVSPEGKVTYCTSCVGTHSYRRKTFQEYAPELVTNMVHQGRSYASPPPHNPQCSRVFASEGPKILSPSDKMTYVLVADDQKIPVQASSGVDVQSHQWFLDQKFLGKTPTQEKLFLLFNAGEHTLGCMDDKGRMTRVHFVVKKVL